MTADQRGVGFRNSWVLTVLERRFGQTDERIPVVARGLDYDEGEGVPNSNGIVRRGIRKSIQLTARLKARE